MTSNTRTKDGYATLTFVLFISAYLSFITLASFDADTALQSFLSSSTMHYTVQYENNSLEEIQKLSALFK
jgi:hypothetical protein